MAGKQPKKVDDFAALLADVKGRIQTAQTRAVLAANAELVRLYWDIGRMIEHRQEREGWGAAVVPRLANSLKNELPELKGFSERNIKRMLAFHRDYPDLDDIVQEPLAPLPASAETRRSDQKAALKPKVPQPVAQLPGSLLWAIPWAHHVILMDKLSDMATRRWYMEQTIANGWSRNILALQIDAHAHARHGKAVSNFAATLPPAQSDLVRQALKDPYIFDCLTLEEPFHERELETELLLKAERFLIDHLPIAGRVVPGLFDRIDEPLYPPVALREALANALCHRDYGSGGGSVGLAIYQDRLEITSAGTLHFELTPEKLYLPHESKPWNPLIARVFHRRGIIESWGRGTLKMVELTRKAGLPRPEFEEGPDYVLVRFRPSRYVPPRQVSQDLTDRQRAILQLLSEKPGIGRKEVLSILKLELRPLKSDLEDLRRLGLIVQRGKGRDSVWHLAE